MTFKKTIGTKIIIDYQPTNFDDEICQCEHSKGYHKAHSLDIHGAECEKCDCKLYTWKTFVFYGYKRGKK